MSSPVGPVVPLPPVLPPAPPEPPEAGTFAEKLDALAWIRGVDAQLSKDAVRIEEIIAGAMTGKDFTNAELLALQAGMYRYTLTIELLSKVITTAVNALRDLLKMQV